MSLSNLNNMLRVFLPLGIMVLIVHPTMTDPQPPTQELITRICRQMEEFGFCNKTFNENLESPTTDIVGLTRIALEQATINATNTHDFVIQLLANTTDETLRNALIACENGYRIVMTAFEDASVAFSEKDYDSMIKYEAVTPRAEGSCEVSFSTLSNNNLINPLVERNREMRILLAMALVSSHILVSISSNTPRNQN